MPPRWGWLALWGVPSSYVLLLSLVAVAAAKAHSLAGMDGVTAWPLLWLWAIAADALVHGGLAALLVTAEARRPRLRVVTVPVAAVVAALGLANAAYLGAAGEQLSWEAVQYGLESWDALTGVVAELVEQTSSVALAAGAAGAVLVPVAARQVAGRREVSRLDSAHCAASLALLALVVWLVAPAPGLLAAASLGRNATVQTYWSWLTDDPAPDQPEPIEFLGYRPPRLVGDADVAALRASERPNVVVLILESTRYDATSLHEDGKAHTPHLLALARSGTSAPVTRAVLPHTTKSVFSMLCGRMPIMQRVPLEVSTAVEVQCLPGVLRAAGYRTGFFQSALGAFEHRPRLVAQLGYEHFEAWEDIGGQPLGYLASDDESLAAPLERWLDAGGPDRDAPFLATLLTSAPHHPYRLPQRDAAAERASGDAAERAGEDADGDASPAPGGGGDASTDEQRYLRLIEAEDRLLGAVLEALDARGLRERTIVVVAGDHGEGFGAKGVLQHDNNFYEEGLRVPLVLAGPGVPAGHEVRGNASLVDVTPSLLGLLGVPAPRLTAAGQPLAFDLLAGPVPEVPRWFGCYYASRCRGFVLGRRKVVHIPQTGQVFYFDLARDPGEHQALPLTPDQAGQAGLADLIDQLPALRVAIDSHRTGRWPMVLGETPAYGQWRCPVGQRCRHPRSPPDLFFEPP